MYIYSSNVESNTKKIPWYQIVNAVVQALKERGVIRLEGAGGAFI